METTRVALALGSGGARGYAHIGAIQELDARGYTITGVAGSSMGALVGALFATGKLDEFTAWARTLTQFDVLRMMDPSLTEPGAIRADRIFERIRTIVGEPLIEELPIPFVAISTDLAAGRSVWFTRGSLMNAVRASIAIPGAITPALVGNRVLADGGILDPLPVVATSAFDADITIGVSLSTDVIDTEWAPLHPAEPGAVEELMGRLRRGAEQLRGPVSSRFPRLAAGLADFASVPEPDEDEASAPKISMFEMMNRSLEVMQATLARHQRAGHPPDVLISIPRTACRVLDFHLADEMISVGREAAAKALDAAGLTAAGHATGSGEAADTAAHTDAPPDTSREDHLRMS